MINPRSDVAVYKQLAAILRRDILTGRLKPGHRLPSETSLQQQYGLARLTVRRAVAMLRAEGLAELSTGHGVVVRERPEMQNLEPAPGAAVTARMPSGDERAEHDVPDGVPVIQVTDPDGSVALFPADRWRLLWPSR